MINRSYKNEEGGFVPEKELKNAELKKYSLSNVEAVVEIVEKNFWKENLVKISLE